MSISNKYKVNCTIEMKKEFNKYWTLIKAITKIIQITDISRTQHNIIPDDGCVVTGFRCSISGDHNGIDPVGFAENEHAVLVARRIESE